LGRSKRREACSYCRQILGRGRVTFSLSLHLYSPLNKVGVFGVGLNVFLSLFFSLQNQFSPSLLAL